jgi:G:T-mismatch repair DNA endonuclease (very short patch repair protein)
VDCGGTKMKGDNLREWIKKNGVWNKGKKHSKEQRQKLKLAWVERKKKGLGIAWNKGLTKETDIRVKRYSDKRKIIQKGKHYSPKTEFKKGDIPYMKGKKHTQKTINKIKKARAKQKATKGWKHNNDTLKRIKEMRTKQILPLKDSSIEIKIQNYLKKLGIEFFTHQYMKIEHGYQCDILIPIQKGIPRPTIIECFGNYWHNYPLSREIDVQRCQELREKGFRVLVFWENEIKVMQLNDLKGALNE